MESVNFPVMFAANVTQMAQIEILDTGTSTRINVIETGNTKTFVAPYNHIRLDVLTDTFFKLQTAAGEFITQGNLGDVTNPVSLTMNDLITNTAFMFTSGGGGGGGPNPIPTLEDIRSVMENIRNWNETYLRAELKSGKYVIENWVDRASREKIPYISTVRISAYGTVNNIEVIPNPNIVGNTTMLPFFQTPPTVAAVCSVVSSDTDDNPAGIGAIVVVVKGLDANFDPIEENVTLNGTTPVNTVNSYIRINEMIIGVSGTNKRNVGNITIMHPTPSQILNFIPAGHSISNTAFYTVPRAHQLIITDYGFEAQQGSSKAALMSYYIRNTLNNILYKVRFSELSSSLSINLNTASVVPEKHDLLLTAERTTGSGTIDVFAFGRALLVNLEDEAASYLTGPDTSSTAPQPYPTDPQTWNTQNS